MSYVMINTEHCSGKESTGTGDERAEGEHRYSSAVSLTSALDGVDGYLHASAALPPRKRTGIHFTEKRVDRRAGLDGCGKYRSYRDSIPGPYNP